MENSFALCNAAINACIRFYKNTNIINDFNFHGLFYFTHTGDPGWRVSGTERALGRIGARIAENGNAQ